MTRPMLALLTLMSLARCTPEPTVESASDDEKVFYAMGVMYAQRLAESQLTEREWRFVVKGVHDFGIKGKEEIPTRPWQLKIPPMLKRRLAEAVQARQDEGQKHREKLVAAGWQQRESGLAYRILKEGNRERPIADDAVLASYRGTLIDGTEFDSRPPESPIQFNLRQVIRGWQEALTLVGEGGEIELAVPAELAYGDNGRPGIPGGSTLLFTVQLHKVIRQAPGTTGGRRPKSKNP